MKEIKKEQVLNTHQIVRLLHTTDNLKYRSILALIYLSRIKIRELRKLKPEDIDWDNSRIYIRPSYHRKDGPIILTSKTCRLLSIYLEKYRPGKWLFERHSKTRPIHTQEIKSIFKTACVKANLGERVPVHNLHKRFPIHSDENWQDICYIREL